jgi:hypothetical protein
MFLSGVLFVLFLAGCWLYCLTDAVLTPAAAFRGLPKPVWVAVIGVTFILGAVAWVIARRLSRPKRGVYLLLASEAVARHPATRSRLADPAVPGRPVGPDDDPEFLERLDRYIQGISDPGELHLFIGRSCLLAVLASVSSGRRRSACR